MGPPYAKKRSYHVLYFTVGVDALVGLGWSALQFLGLIQGARWQSKTCNQNLALYCLISGILPIVFGFLSFLYFWLISLKIPRNILPAWRISLNEIYNKKYNNAYGARRLAPPHTQSWPHSALLCYQPPNLWICEWVGPRSGRSAPKKKLYELNGLYTPSFDWLWDDHPVHEISVSVTVLLLIACCLAIIGWLIYGTYMISKSNDVLCYGPLYKLALSTVILNWTVPPALGIFSIVLLTFFL